MMEKMEEKIQVGLNNTSVLFRTNELSSMTKKKIASHENEFEVNKT